MTFSIDNRIAETCFTLADWQLSRVLLKNNACYPWFILVPRRENLQEIEQLTPQDRIILIDEISRLSALVREYFKPDKMNVGALGNIVSQLHIHVVARFTTDALWPHGVWQTDQKTTPYSENALDLLLAHFRLEIKGVTDQ